MKMGFDGEGMMGLGKARGCIWLKLKCGENKPIRIVENLKELVKLKPLRSWKTTEYKFTI